MHLVVREFLGSRNPFVSLLSDLVFVFSRDAHLFLNYFLMIYEYFFK